jgi:hypothetical protein
MIHKRSKESMEKRVAYRKSIGRTTVPPGTLAEQVQYGEPVTNMTMWRTPDAAAGGSNLPGIQKALDEGHLKRPSGQSIQIRLQDQVKEPRLWPTPVHSDHLMNKSETLEAWKIRAKKKKEENGVNLQYALRHAVQKHPIMWPTPRVSGQENLDTLIKRKGLREATQHNLTAAVQNWPTPTANEDAAGRPGAKMQKMLGNHPEVRKPLDGGTLNPTWVEWLMGYPTGHTDLKR